MLNNGDAWGRANSRDYFNHAAALTSAPAMLLNLLNSESLIMHVMRL